MKPKPIDRTEVEELAWISRAYLDAAVHLRESMRSDDFPDSYHRNRIPLYLCHHALELLYKSALLAAGQTYPKTHSVAALRDLCMQYVSDCGFETPTAFREAEGFSADLLGNFPKVYFDNLQERCRYVVDGKGRRMPAPPLLKPATLLEQLRTLEIESFPIFLRLVDISRSSNKERSLGDRPCRSDGY